MNKHTRTQNVEINLQNEIRYNTTYLEFLHAHRATLEALDVKFSFFSDYIDFDNLDRPDLLRVLKAFPGKWNKTPTYAGEGLNYALEDKICGLNVRCYNGAPPPSCVIEERTEWVTVPARVEKRVTRTVKCPELTSAASPS